MTFAEIEEAGVGEWLSGLRQELREKQYKLPRLSSNSPPVAVTHGSAMMRAASAIQNSDGRIGFANAWMYYVAVGSGHWRDFRGQRPLTPELQKEYLARANRSAFRHDSA